MDKWSNNRITVIGSKTHLQRFLKSKWDERLGARYIELLENSPTRFASQFETDCPPLQSITGLSRRSPPLTFILEYEVEAERIRGLAKAKGGKLTQYQVSY